MMEMPPGKAVRVCAGGPSFEHASWFQHASMDVMDGPDIHPESKDKLESHIYHQSTATLQEEDAHRFPPDVW